MDNEIYPSQQLQQVTAQVVQEIIGGIIMVVFLVWGLRQVVRAFKGEPIEQAPL